MDSKNRIHECIKCFCISYVFLLGVEIILISGFFSDSSVISSFQIWMKAIFSKEFLLTICVAALGFTCSFAILAKKRINIFIYVIGAALFSSALMLNLLGLAQNSQSEYCVTSQQTVIFTLLIKKENCELLLDFWLMHIWFCFIAFFLTSTITYFFQSIKGDR